MKGLSRMRGDSHVRFLGEDGVVTHCPYPTEDAHWCRRHTGADSQHRHQGRQRPDIVPGDKLLHGEEWRVLGDAGYLGIQKRAEHKHRKDVSWFIAKRPGTLKKLDADKLIAEKIKTSIRAKVEHPFQYIKQVFGYSKVRYRGLSKNNNQPHLLAAFTNLMIGEKHLLA